MAHAQKKTFPRDSDSDGVSQAPVSEALGSTPFAFWSNMAEMQRQYLTSITRGAADKAEIAANVAELRPTGIAAPAAISRNWMVAAAECQRELASFAKDRMAKNQAFLSSVAAAPGVPELMQLQTGWMTETAQDYTAELGKLSDIVKNGADEALAVTA
jgi:hypothetical protein